MRLFRLLCFPITLALAGPSLAQLAADADPLRIGGMFRARADSVTYDEYRKLPGRDQLERREEAWKWMRRGNDTADPDAYATAVGLCPYLPQAWIGYAHAMHEQGLYDDALTCLRHARRTLKYELREKERADITGDYHGLHASVAYNHGDYETSLEQVQKALQFHPRRGELLLLHARVLQKFDRVEEAKSILFRFKDDDPDYAHSLAELGALHLRENQLERADDAFQQAYKYGKRGPVFENDRGRLCLADGRLEDAVGHFRTAIEKLPSFGEARSNLAVAYRRLGRLDLAERVLRDCVQEIPGYAPAHFNLAEVYRAQAQEAPEVQRLALLQRASENYEAALGFGYDPETVIRRQATLSVQGEDLERAEESLLELAEDPGVDGRVLYLLGRVKKEQGEFQIAANLFDMAAKRGYDAVDLHSDFGEVLLRTGDLEGARVHLAAAAKQDPELVVTRVNLSVVLSRLGRLTEADAVLREAERLAPESELVKTQRDALRKMGVDG